MLRIQRVGACCNPIRTLFATGWSRSSARNSPSQQWSRPSRHRSRNLFKYRSMARLFSSKTVKPSSTNSSSAQEKIHACLQTATLFLPRLVAFCGTVYVTTEYGFNTVSCEGPSMEPTIIDGSFTCVLIDRFSHRIFGLEENDNHCNRTDDDVRDGHRETIKATGADETETVYDNSTWLGLLKGVWEQHFTSGLQRGDVIILHHPSKEATICKRIIGMPGDTIIRTDGGSRETNHRVKISPGHLWIEGDNTLESHDSRAYGAVPASLIIGKVVCRLWPVREYASLGLDAYGIEHWQRVSGRIGRRDRPMPLDKNERFEGSHVMRMKKC